MTDPRKAAEEWLQRAKTMTEFSLGIRQDTPINGYLAGYAAAEQRWVPVSERLPEPNELVLVVSEGVMTFGHMIRPGYWEVIRDGGEWLDVSHWLQIPTLPPKTGEGMEDQKTFLVEYEIPPLRAIYRAECDAVSDADVRAHIAEVQPRWRIRKITLPPNTGSGE